ncbi:MAG: hypothetical protein PHH14_07455, partial [Candidatus Margulisbacteria bacterium]|nr:hypothetical protein [Candidatus Margulisiibacteriota bacterium]
MALIMIAGVISLVMGVLLLFPKEVLRGLLGWLEKPVLMVDELVNSVRIPVGIVLVIIGGWVISVAFNYPELWYLHVIGVVVVFFGLLNLFLPQWVGIFSKVADRLVFSTDEMVLGLNRTAGIILVICGLYILLITSIFGKIKGGENNEKRFYIDRVSDGDRY